MQYIYSIMLKWLCQLNRHLINMENAHIYLKALKFKDFKRNKNIFFINS